ncbi:VWA domain-containing protein [Iamia sp. SCSIO 61187]|uniref:vWA domain-containing protein n=1 Tax=Iamia sp. SCSIO 61187 TaxID=2722752 RepID=UPI001C631CB9|nr:VWA domain-containing protein [Iamia sp. SCSIO 61187]QYG94691.1 VWA domain-containing protein [Iamia sp. SCSIO 61187]
MTAGTADAGPGGLRDVDRAAFAVALAHRLRGAGCAVPLTAAETLAEALAACPPVDRSRLYWTTRVSLLRREQDRERFDAAFAAVFDAVLGVDPHARRRPPSPDAAPVEGAPAPVPGPDPEGDDADETSLPWATLPATITPVVAADEGTAVPERRPSDRPGPLDLPFADLDPDDLATLAASLGAALGDWPRRRSRRHAHHPAGHRVALRATIARSRRTAWEPVDLVRTRAVTRPRRIVVLCDVSRSMQPHAAALFHLMRVMATGAHAEVFAFSTTLTRLTPVLAHRSPERAVDLASSLVDDRFGGTRIATNVHALLRGRHGDATRGAIVVVASDGWDADAPEALAAEMARLRRRAHRVVWLNPRLAAPGFAPEVGALAAALPHVDAHLPAHSLRALAAALAAVGDAAH